MRGVLAVLGRSYTKLYMLQPLSLSRVAVTFVILYRHLSVLECPVSVMSAILCDYNYLNLRRTILLKKNVHK